MKAAVLGVFCAASVFIGGVGMADQPIALSPQNPHYFVWHGKPTVLVTSGEHYGAVLNLDFDYRAYLETLAADGLNHTRVFSGTYREILGSFNITDNTLAPRPLRFISPWARSDRPGYFDGGNRFDLTRWDPAYFERLRAFMTAARQHGVVVEMNLFCPLYNDPLWAASPMNARNNVNGVGDCPRGEVLALKHPRLTEVQLAVTRKLVTELNAFDNLYFEVCNEPYAGNVPEAWQARIVQEIVDVEKKLPHRHLISMNIANGRKKVEHPLPEVSILNFHYCVPPDTVALNFGLNRVIGENETGFRGPQDLLYRSEGWDFLLAGGALYNNLDYSFTAAHPRGTLRDYRSPGGGSPELRKQLGILKHFLEGFDFVRMKPDRQVIESVTDKLTASALSEPGKAYAVYLHVPLPMKPKKFEDLLRDDIRARLTLRLPPGRYRAEWVDTLTGAARGQEQFEHAGGTKPLATPTFSNDIALRIVGRQ
jgi:hypothetical protein